MVLLAVKEEKASNIHRVEHCTWSGEAVAFCPGCHALQTVWLSNNTLLPTRKFYQFGGQIYHDCGSGQPCRLYHG